MRKILFILAASFCLLGNSWSQENVTTFGIQFKPILPVKVFVDGPIDWTDSIYSGTLSSKTGYSFGMVIRKGFNKRFSLETGINYVKRYYDASMSKKKRTQLY